MAVNGFGKSADEYEAKSPHPSPSLCWLLQRREGHVDFTNELNKILCPVSPFADIIGWMPDLDDQQLLREFVESHSETAFATLVARHVNLVHSTALRFCGNPHSAEEITQAVFIILARKAGSLGKNIVLSGWLYQTARLTASSVVKREIRRQHREQEAYIQSTLNEPGLAAWEQIAPLLEDAMGQLGETDRNALLLRFFENKTAGEVATALQFTEAAAHKRVSRALEKLRQFFLRRGVNSTTTAISETISTHSIPAAPATLAKSVTEVALAKGAAASTSTLTLVKGALKIMAWTKAKTAVAVAVVVLIAGGTTTITVKRFESSRFPDQWWEHIADLDLASLRAAFVLRPTHFHRDKPVMGQSQTTGARTSRGRMIWMIGRDENLRDLVFDAYNDGESKFNWVRIIFPQTLPQGHYDYLATVTNSPQRLQAEIKRQLGIVAHAEVRETNVFLLNVIDRPLLNSKAIPGNTMQWFNETQPLSDMLTSWENLLEMPIVDQTESTNRYAPRGIALPDRKNLDAFKKDLAGWGLELIPTNMPIELLVVEKVK